MNENTLNNNYYTNIKHYPNTPIYVDKQSMDYYKTNNIYGYNPSIGTLNYLRWS